MIERLCGTEPGSSNRRGHCGGHCLLTDSGYVVLKAPNLPRHFEMALELADATERQATVISPVAQTLSNSLPSRELMILKEFCSRYSISGSTAHVEINSGRLKYQKIGRSTRISEKAASQWLRAYSDRQS
jgi:hypothetical protein